MERFEPTIKLQHADSRGEIYSISLPGDQELMLLHSKAGSLRGGHSHSVDEVVVVLMGGLRYYKKIAGGELITDLHAGETSFTPAGQVHLGGFLEEDTWLIERKIGARKEEWKNDVEYKPYRDRVVANAAS